MGINTWWKLATIVITTKALKLTICDVNVIAPELNVGKLTVGKVYGGLLILENWKATRFGQVEATTPMVCHFVYFAVASILFLCV